MTIRTTVRPHSSGEGVEINLRVVLSPTELAMLNSADPEYMALLRGHAMKPSTDKLDAAFADAVAGNFTPKKAKGGAQA